MEIQVNFKELTDSGRFNKKLGENYASFDI